MAPVLGRCFLKDGIWDVSSTPPHPLPPLPGLRQDIPVEISVNNLGGGSSPDLLRDRFSDTLLSVSRFHPRVLRGELNVSGYLLVASLKGLTPPHQIPRVGMGPGPVPNSAPHTSRICCCLGASGPRAVFNILLVPSLLGLRRLSSTSGEAGLFEGLLCITDSLPVV